MTKLMLIAVTVFVTGGANFAAQAESFGEVVVLSQQGKALAHYQIDGTGFPPKLKDQGEVDNADYFLSLKPNMDGVQYLKIRFSSRDARANLTHLFALKDQLETSQNPLTIYIDNARRSADTYFARLNQLRIGSDSASAVAGADFVKRNGPIENADHSYLDFTGGSPMMRNFVPGE